MQLAKSWVVQLVNWDKPAVLPSLRMATLLPGAYDKVSDVVESGVRFASKILTPHRMH